MTERYVFPKTSRLLKNSEFRTVFARRLVMRDDLLALYALENSRDFPRLGVSIGKSCGKAVVRNRLKRLIREAFRQNQHRIRPGFDYVVTMSPRWVRQAADKAGAKNLVKQLKFGQICDSLLDLMARLTAKTA